MSLQEEKAITFEQLPQAVAMLISEVREIKSLITKPTKVSDDVADHWFNLEELCAYLPDKPAKQTVYGWIGQHYIPYHKKRKKLQFLKSEIDEWLMTDKRKSLAELQAEAARFVGNKKGGLR